MASLLASCVLFGGAGCEADDVAFGIIDVASAPTRYDDADATRRLRVAAVSMTYELDPERNLEAMEGWVRSIEAEHPETDLVLFGETSLGWYYRAEAPEDYQRAVAEPIPGPATERLGAVARELDLRIAFGVGELDGDALFNSLVVLGRDGEVEATHRKVRLTDEDREGGFLAGDAEAVTVDLDGIRAGLMVCADSHCPRLLTGLADARIEVLLISLAADIGDLGYRVDPLARILGAWVVFANRVGDEGEMTFEGLIYVADPAGAFRRKESGEEGYVWHDLGVH
jgi:predicted amidohydrolase